MKNLDADKVLAVQFLRAGRGRLTFQESETCAQVLKDGLDLGDFSVDLALADDRLRTVHLRDLPVEIAEEVVSSFLAGFGEVLSVSHCFFDDYPSVRNCNRVAKILLDHDIPQYVEVDGCNCRVWYPRQPPQCSVCREFSHRAPACPLSGRCRRCHQPGHMARECTQAWGPPFSVSRTDHSMETEDDSDTSSSASDDVSSTTASVPAPVVTSPPVISTCSAAIVTSPAVTSPRVISTCSTAAVSTSGPTVAVTAPVTFSTCTVSTAASVPSTSVQASTASAPKSSNSASTASTPLSKKPRTIVSAMIFRKRLTRHCSTIELPSFDGVVGKEWDSRAKAYLRQQIKIIFDNKKLGITNRDLVTWKEEELVDPSNDICEILCIKNYLKEFIYGIVRGYWINAKNVTRET